MRLGLICRPFSFHGGVETATAGLLTALRHAGHDVELISTRRQASVPGLVVRRVPTLRHPSVLRLISFVVADGAQPALERARGILQRLKLLACAESLGGVESLIEHPGRMTHASVAGSELEVPADLTPEYHGFSGEALDRPVYLGGALGFEWATVRELVETLRRKGLARALVAACASPRGRREAPVHRCRGARRRRHADDRLPLGHSRSPRRGEPSPAARPHRP